MAISEALRNVRKLKTLKLGRNSIDDRSATVIAENIVASEDCGVRSLDLGHNVLGEKRCDWALQCLYGIREEDGE